MKWSGFSGAGRPANEEFGYLISTIRDNLAESGIKTWEKAFKEGKVQVWGHAYILSSWPPSLAIPPATARWKSS